MGKKQDGERVVCHNRRAAYDYEILKRYEAGIILTGSEVKSLRAGGCHLKDSYVQFVKGEAFLEGCHISPYPPAGNFNHNPERERKILLTKKELSFLQGKVREKGLSIIPLKIYFKGNLAKVEIFLGKGKKRYDRREELKRRDAEREMERYWKGQR